MKAPVVYPNIYNLLDLLSSQKGELSAYFPSEISPAVRFWQSDDENE